MGSPCWLSRERASCNPSLLVFSRCPTWFWERGTELQPICTHSQSFLLFQLIFFPPFCFSPFRQWTRDCIEWCGKPWLLHWKRWCDVKKKKLWAPRAAERRFGGASRDEIKSSFGTERRLFLASLPLPLDGDDVRVSGQSQGGHGRGGKRFAPY